MLLQGVAHRRAADADALAQQGYVDSVTPTISGSKTLRFENLAATGSLDGAAPLIAAVSAAMRRLAAALVVA